MSIENRLKVWRGYLGMTQAIFAESVGMPLRTLKGYEMGERLPGCEALAAIASTGCNINWLLTGKGQMCVGAQEKPLQAAELRAISGKSGPMASDEIEASASRRLGAITSLVAALDNPQEQAALLDELFSRAQNAAEMHALKQAVAELRAAQKKAA